MFHANKSKARRVLPIKILLSVHLLFSHFLSQVQRYIKILPRRKRVSRRLMISQRDSGQGHRTRIFPATVFECVRVKARRVRAQCSGESRANSPIILRIYGRNSAFCNKSAHGVTRSHRRRAYDNSYAVARPPGGRSLFQIAGQVGDLSCRRYLSHNRVDNE